ncbi:MAG: hypothetical protein KQH57_06790 [Actinomycetales bacterium]|nr:hypothetical protein [Actinomycetales bacterium]
MTDGGVAQVLLVILRTDPGAVEAAADDQATGTLRIRVVRRREAQLPELVGPGQPPPSGAVPLRMESAKAAADLIVDYLTECGDQNVVAVALDQVSAFALWHVAQELPDVIAVSTLEAGERIAALLRAGRSVASILNAPQFSVTRVLTEAEPGPRVAVSTPAVVAGDEPRADGRWLSFEPDGLHVVLDAMAPQDRAEVEALTASASRDGAVGDDPKVVIGPANFAGQGWAWARALNAHTRAQAVNLAVRTDGSRIVFRSTLPLTVSEWDRPAVRVAIAADLLERSTHVLLEAARPLVAVDAVAPAHGDGAESARRDVEALLAAGKQVALLFHGSEVRDPAAHASLDAWSPFGNPANDGLSGILAARVGNVRKALLRDLDVLRYVSTLDLFDYVPGAIWLPVVVDRASFAPTPEALRGPIPVVGHAPTSSVLKGSRWIDPVLEKLDSEGVIRYRRFQALPPGAVPRMLRDVDVLVDQVVLGNPGVLAAQAMAAGRLVVSHLPESVRRRLPEPIPVVEANPSTLEEVMRAIASAPALYAATAAAGRQFAQKYHDGRASADILAATFLAPPAAGVPVSAPAGGAARW